MNRLNIPDIHKRLSPDQVADFPGQAGYSHRSKKAYQIFRLGLIAAPTRISVAGAGEIYVKSDRPIMMGVGSPNKITGPLLQAHYKGNLQDLYFARTSVANVTGRLVIYEGRPRLGDLFMPDHLLPAITKNVGAAAATWDAATSNANLGEIALGWDTFDASAAGVFPDGKEAIVIHSIDIFREAGLINRFEIVETESMVFSHLHVHWEKYPTNILRWCPNLPLHVGSSFRVQAYGSSELGDTVTSTAINHSYI